MSFAICEKPCPKCKGDLAGSFPTIGRCLKCFKHLLINPFTLCAISPGKKNYDRYNKGSESYGLVSFSFLIISKANIALDSSQSFGGLPVLGRYHYNFQGIP
jgi:hypothetical protein